MSGRILAVVLLAVAAGTSCIIENSDPCDNVFCPAGQYCMNGFCYDDPCDPNPCPTGYTCAGGSCYPPSDPCSSVHCPAGYTCSGGTCYPPVTCNPACAPGWTCVDGVCHAPVDRCNPNPCSAGQWCVDGSCYGEGMGCDFVDDQDCVNVTQAWWCSPDGYVYVNDCIEQCTGLGMPYACCGYDPGRSDDACLCCARADCSGLTCEGTPPDPCNPNPCLPGQWCVGGTCYGAGDSCDYVDDQDCVNNTQAWWCSPDGHVYVNDCVTQCAGLAPYTCCGYDPARHDDACLCCATADCSGYTCHG